jgi:uncharacterized protein (DUF849 family)
MSNGPDGRDRGIGPVVIEAALNGGTPKSRNPHVPTAAGEIAADALACLGAGAAIIHTHIDDLSKTGEAAAECYLQGWRPVLATRPDAILCSTVATGATPQERFAHYRPLADQGMRMASLDPGSVNLGTQGKDGLPGRRQFVYANSYSDIAYLVALHEEARLGPSIAIYEAGFLRTVLAYHRAGRLPRGALVKLYFGGPYIRLAADGDGARRLSRDDAGQRPSVVGGGIGRRRRLGWSGPQRDRARRSCARRPRGLRR